MADPRPMTSSMSRGGAVSEAMVGDASSLGLVERRTLLSGSVEVRFPLAPGDRCLVTVGDVIVAGTTIAERLRDAHVVAVPSTATAVDARPGERWTDAGPLGKRPKGLGEADSGELLHERDGRWSLAVGEVAEAIDCPFGGVVREVRPGIEIRIVAQGRTLAGVEALGDPTSGQLSLGGDRGDPGHGQLRSTSLDVGLAGTILVIGSRVDAEALTRARAMGVRGVVVSGLAGKERRDFLASEDRQRAALHRRPPFAVLVLDGALRRPIAGPVAAILDALAGVRVAITVDPPALIFDQPGLRFVAPPTDHVRVRTGDHAGEEGQWAGPAGLRRFVGGTFLEAGWIVLHDGSTVPVPIADLERFG